RNLKIVNSPRSCPKRSCRNKAGPGLSSRMTSAIRTRSGLRTNNSRLDTRTSNKRFSVFMSTQSLASLVYKGPKEFDSLRVNVNPKGDHHANQNGTHPEHHARHWSPAPSGAWRDNSVISQPTAHATAASRGIGTTRR